MGSDLFTKERLEKIFTESLPREIINANEIIAMGLYDLFVKQYIEDSTWNGKSNHIPWLSLLVYGCEVPSRRKRIPVDVDKMVETWLPLVKELAVAHDIDARDKASQQLDEHLTPLLSCPIAQLREFYQKLTQALKNDQTVPWAVWKLFEFWGKNVLEKLDKPELVGLKTTLAKEIAERSFEQISKEDWVNSMVKALEWRSPERLEEVKGALESGKKPRVRGGQSCLFLEVGDVEVQL